MLTFSRAIRPLRQFCSLAQAHKKQEMTDFMTRDLTHELQLSLSEVVERPFEHLYAEATMGSLDVNDMLNEKIGDYWWSTDKEFTNKDDDKPHYDRPLDFSCREKSQKHIFEFPRRNKFKRVPAGELFRVQRDAEYKKAIARSNGHIEGIQTPVDLREENLVNLAARISAEPTKENLEELNEMMSKLNYDIFPRLALYLSHEVRVTERTVWTTLEQEVRENLHFMSFDELCQLLYSFSEMKGSGVSVNLRQTIQEKILAQLP